ncbi:zinc finger, C3HC4 type (RING finger) protein (macronuclear) [Tetrahymena thermophila SB210]|uniref:RING-type E3 ubiquitin transferase n=1 Tax=Tetrahymena thermophila (strain SB210) TaxID=312017 RepID=Q22YG9_TETTS|nr:zinc finger, C3HC4 type (RING finger) protein [Tetrahymena thermophila SB210]EAR90316.4 zinc finger, C3HC4 type (RING finger) protein [Tetrahymena thermophila SB210]|eukprot:XP_001010561.4 zinc finger, C3HC4 type (RING finger) protein [Tetrahymena thermophila SB210]
MNYGNNIIPMNFNQGSQNYYPQQNNQVPGYQQRIDYNNNNNYSQINDGNATQNVQQLYDELCLRYSELLDQNQIMKKEIEDKNYLIESLQAANNDLASEKEIYLIQLRELENNRNLCVNNDNFSFIRDSQQEKKQIEEMKKFEKKKSQKQNQVSSQQSQNQYQGNNQNRHINNYQQRNYNLRQRQQNNNNSRQNNNNFGNLNLDVENMSYEQLLELENQMGKVHTGFTRQQIEALNIIEFDGSKMQNVDKSCSICQNDYEDKDKLRLLNPCLHLMHQQCVDQWLLQNKKCPICQTEVQID